MTPAQAPDYLAKIYQLLGQVVLLPIPLGQKGPDLKGWEALSFGDTQQPDYQRRLYACLERGGNLGASLGPVSGRLLAIDADSDQTAERLLAQFPWLADTFRTRGKRGCQFWLRLESDCDYPIAKAVYKYDGGEFRLGGGRGAQSIFWGVHPDGMLYQILVKNPPREISLADLDEIAAACGVDLSKKDTEALPGPRLNQASAYDSSAWPAFFDKHVKPYIDKCEPAISGRNGHDTTYKVACALVRLALAHGAAIDREQLFDAMGYYNAKCQPPWSEAELAHKVDNALEKAFQQAAAPVQPASANGASSAPTQPAPDPPFSEQLKKDLNETEQETPELWKPESLVVLSEAEIDSSQTLLGKRWLEREHGCLVVGPSGVGKSTWSIQLAFLLAAGRHAFAISNSSPRKVLIVQAEDNRNDRIEMARMLPALDLSMWRGFPCLPRRKPQGISRARLRGRRPRNKSIHRLSGWGRDTT
jgi:hypothetical protein